MTASTPLPQTVRDSLDTWLLHHDEAAPGLIEGFYLVGSLALGNWQPSSDIDIIAFTAEPPTDAEVEAMRSAHVATVDELGGVDIDGQRLTWRDVASRPQPIVRPWTLAGEFHHDDGCFENNPVIWFTLATYGLAVRGPAVSDLDIAVDASQVHEFVQDNTEHYWRSVADSINSALDDPDRDTFNADLTSWSILGVARMLYTARTSDVTSKSGAGEWLANELPEHRTLIEHALKIRANAATPTDNRQTAQDTAALMNRVADLVAATDQ